MGETAFFKGEGGAVWEMDLPLSAAHACDEKEGRLCRVNPDGSPLTEEPEATKPAGRKRASKAPSKEE